MRAEAMLLCFLFIACDEQLDPEVPEAPAFTCDTACENLRALECPEAETTAEGSECEEVCQNSFEVGIEMYEWDVETLTNTATCDVP